MMKKISILFLIVSAFSLLSCSSDALSSDSVVDSNKSSRNETDLDSWIKENFTQPYNISVKYRWDSNTAPKGSYLYPPNPENVKKVLEAIKYLWLETYELPRLGGENFMKGKSPVVIRLYGGKNVDSRGVELLSNSETTGAEMFIYNVDEFDASDRDNLFILMRSVHHQFAKKLTEVIPYNRDQFVNISKNKYTGSTEKISRKQYNSRIDIFKLNNNANKEGFYTVYGTISAEEDFAEMISATLTHTPREISEAENNAKTPHQDYGSESQVQEKYNEQAKRAYQAFTQKKKMVEEYFDKKVKINLTRLQLASIQRMNRYVDTHKD